VVDTEECMEMELWRDLPIGRKLAASFGLVVLLIGALTGVALWGMSSLSSAFENTATNVMPKIEAAEDVRTWAADLNGWQTGYVLDEGRSRADFEKSLASTKESVATLVARSNDAEDKKAAAEITQALAAFVAFDAQIWDAVQTGQEAKAQQLVLGPAIELYTAFAKGTERYVKQAIAEGDAAQSSFASTKSTSVIIILAVAALALAFAVGIAIVVTRGIKGPIAAVLERMQSLEQRCVAGLRAGLEAMAGGDLTVRVTPVTTPVEDPSADEIGHVSTAFNNILGGTQASIEAYNEMIGKLSGVIGDVAKAAEAVADASRQMAATSEETGRAVEEIANAVGDVAQGAERQVRMVDEARASAEETASKASEARLVAQEGVRASERATEAMRSVREATGELTGAMGTLAEKSERIGDIVETITGIAGQTNLLALNAAIEAARAGDQGRGFAVVADEVRKLAEESQGAAASIAALIREMQDDTARLVGVVEEGARRTEEGAEVVDQAREAFLQIGDAVEEMVGRIGEIATSTSEVAAVAEQSSAGAQQVSASTEETSASTEEIAASAQELAGTAQGLEELVRQFRIP
jgi:methyl-accepting chemotaxis protein